MSLHFEWDPRKANANQKKHHVSFEFASRVFLDPYRQDAEDLERDSGEERRRVVGYIEGRLIFVSYTERKGKVRIISARKASAREQRAYADAVSP